MANCCPSKLIGVSSNGSRSTHYLASVTNGLGARNSNPSRAHRRGLIDISVVIAGSPANRASDVVTIHGPLF